MKAAHHPGGETFQSPPPYRQFREMALNEKEFRNFKYLPLASVLGLICGTPFLKFENYNTIIYQREYILWISSPLLFKMSLRLQ